MEKHNDGQHRSPSYEPDGSDTGQRTRWRDHHNKTAVSHEEARNHRRYPSRPEVEREQQVKVR